MRHIHLLGLLALMAGCSHGSFSDPVPLPQQAAAPAASPAAPPTPAPAPSAAAAPRADTVIPPRQRVAPPRVAFQLGLMPVASTGVTGLRLAHPTYDGRGVLIAILDSGVDPGIEGLQRTSTGDNKILDLRDFSGEGDIALHDAGNGRWTGELRELPFGPMPQGDFNGNGTNRDVFRIEVMRDSLGWAARIDANGDGSLDDEPWYHDFLVKREVFTFASAHVARGRGPISAAFNLSDEGGRPKLSVYLDTSGHGAHVSGIAAGYNMYGVTGFNGVAPGAQIIGLRIADNVRGGVSTTGSMLRGMEYAARFARERNLPLVLNMSFGVGNADEGRAVMDSIIDAFLLVHPDVFFAMAAGNDGPGTSTLGQPGSAELGVGVGASYPASFAAVQFNTPTETMGWWSSRGGELAKPDIVAPGVAYSTVPGWNTGDEIKGGTSMASPHVAGLAAVLISAMVQEHRTWSAASIMQALRATARPFAGAPWIDQGPGLAQVEPAYTWLRGSHDVVRYSVRVQAGGGPTPPGLMPGGRSVAPAARAASVPGVYFRSGLPSPADTLASFRVSMIPDPGVARQARSYRLTSSAPWLHAVSPTVTIDGTTGSAVVPVHFDAAAFAGPGRYSGVITGVSTTDSTGGPAFVLASTIIVPHRLPLSVRAKTARAGAAERYFIPVPEGAPGLGVRIVIADTTAQGSLSLFEPTGRPARGVKSEDLGGENGKAASISISADDIVPGVWEVVVQALPGRDLTFDLDVRLPQAHVTAVDAAARPSVAADAPGLTPIAKVELLGADTAWTESLEHSPDRFTFAVPDWARAMVAEVDVTPGTWDQVTDFAITMYDADGARIGNGAMNYPFHRVSADLPEHREAGYRATLELFPAFARPDGSRLQANVRVRFEGEPVEVTAGAVPSTWSPPPGWRTVLRGWAGVGAMDWTSSSKLFGLGAR